MASTCLCMISTGMDHFMIYSTFQMSTASHLAGTLVSRSHSALPVHWSKWNCGIFLSLNLDGMNYYIIYMLFNIVQFSLSCVARPNRTVKGPCLFSSICSCRSDLLLVAIKLILLLLTLSCYP